jgi:hypothetical protein
LRSARDAGVDSAHLAALAPSVKRAKTGDEAGRGGQPRAWVSGTGYGSGSRGGEAQVWDARQAASAQDAQVVISTSSVSAVAHGLNALKPPATGPFS